MVSDGAAGLGNGEVAQASLEQNADRGFAPADGQGYPYPLEAYLPQSSDPRALGMAEAGAGVAPGAVDAGNMYTGGDPNASAIVSQGQQFSYAPDGYMQMGAAAPFGAGMAVGQLSPGMAYRPGAVMSGAEKATFGAEDQLQLGSGRATDLVSQAQALPGGAFYPNDPNSALAAAGDQSLQPLTVLDPRALAVLSIQQQQGLGPEAYYPRTRIEEF